MISISHIDHIVLTVKDIPASVKFYARVLGMQIISFGNKRTALKFGNQKINLHQTGNEYKPNAKQATPGSTDLCLITDTNLELAMAFVKSCNVEIIEGSVERTGATGKLLSFYIRDPDQNLIEIANILSP